MWKRTMTAVGLCAAALAIAAPAASATTASDYHDTCTADAKWQLTLFPLGPSYADVTLTNIVCDSRTTSADTDGLDESSLSNHWGPYDSNEVPHLELTGIVGGVAMVATAQDTTYPEFKGVVSVADGELTATIQAVTTPNGSVLHRSGQYYPVGQCGSNCFLTKGVWVDSEVAAS